MAKKSKSKPENKRDALWAKAKRLCRLSMEDIRKAKELGMTPRGLIKNIPSKSEPWKAPVRIWIRDLYEKRFGRRKKKAARQQGKKTRPDAPRHGAAAGTAARPHGKPLSSDGPAWPKEDEEFFPESIEPEIGDGRDDEIPF